MESLFVGVDGGATKCMVSVEDSSGQLLGRAVAGPANIRISVPKAWQSIHAALTHILAKVHIEPGDKAYHWHAGMGLAGCEVVSAYEAFLQQQHFFETLIVTSDAHTACLGAHAGQDGSIIIIGTGVAGFQVQENHTTKIGGWGFPHDDEGGGAWLGLQAMKITLQALDGRMPASQLSSLVYARFDNSLERLVSWANQANSTAYAELAPLVIEQCEAGDKVALNIMQQAASAINRLGDALQAAQMNQESVLPCVLVGGVAPFIEPYLGAKLRSHLAPCQFTPDVGAILLVRDHIKRGEHARN